MDSLLANKSHALRDIGRRWIDSEAVKRLGLTRADSGFETDIVRNSIADSVGLRKSH